MSNFVKQSNGALRGTAIQVADLPTSIPNANLATMANNTVKGNISGSSAVPSDVSAVSTATASTVMVRDTNANIQANNFIDNVTTTATAAGTTTLTVSSTYAQQFTGTTTQTVVLPNATTLANGQSFLITNRSTGVVTVNANGGGLTQTMAAGSQTVLTLISNATSAGVWDSSYSTTSAASPLTTKGDIYTYSTTNARQAVPNDYGRLIPDSTQSTGWRSASYNQIQQGRPGKNYIQYADFENNSTTGWTLGTIGTLTNGLPTGTPTFGSGASGNLSISATSSSIEGNYSLSYASSAATTQGNMVATSSYAIDVEDQAKVLTVKFYYTAASGASNCNFSGTSSNSFAWAIYDVTNSSWLTSTGNFNLIQSSGCGYVTGTCQTNATTANIRLVVYNANATSGAATLTLDGFYVGPQTAPSGPVMSDWTLSSVTPSGGFGSVGSVLIYQRRVGDSLEYNFNWTNGPSPSGTAYLPLPSGLSIDYTKISSSSSGTVVGYGNETITGSSRAISNDMVDWFVDGSTTGEIFWTQSAGSSALTKGSANGSRLESGFIKVPIVGWSSNSNLSSDTDTRVVAMSADGVPSNANSGNPIIFPTIVKDTHAAYNSSTGKYTVPVTGWYTIGAVLDCSTDNIGVLVNQNGSNTATVGWLNSNGQMDGYTILYCNAGDLLFVTGASNITGFGGSAINNALLISRICGPAVVAATEVVNALYYQSSSNAPGANTQINFDTKIDDTHNAVTTGAGAWKWTCPKSGRYTISTNITYNTGTAGQISLYKNGSNYAYMGNTLGTTAGLSAAGTGASITIPLNAGDYIDIRPFSSTSIYGSGFPIQTYISITATGRGN